MLTLTYVVGERPPHPAGGRLVHEWADEAGDVYARAFSSAEQRWIDWTGLATFAFARGSTAVRAWPSPGVRRQLIAETFTRMLQPIVMQAIGWQALHASAVVVGGGVVALCGRSGSGKSTIAYALGQRYDQWADDGVVVRPSEGGAVARRVAFTPRLRPESRLVLGKPRQTRVVLTGAGRELPLRLVAVLRQEFGAARTVQCRRLPAAEAFQALVTHAHCFDPGEPDDARRFAEDYLAIASTLPVVDVTYRPGLGHLEAVTAAVLRSVAHDADYDERSATLPRI